MLPDAGSAARNVYMTEGDWVDGGVPAIGPITPGHAVTGNVESVGDGMADFKAGDRVGVTPLFWALRSERVLHLGT